jgi:hypothetical protein
LEGIAGGRHRTGFGDLDAELLREANVPEVVWNCLVDVVRHLGAKGDGKANKYVISAPMRDVSEKNALAGGCSSHQTVVSEGHSTVRYHLLIRFACSGGQGSLRYSTCPNQRASCVDVCYTEWR